MNMKEYWQQAVTFEEYIKDTEKKTANPIPEDPYTEYYELGMVRMSRTLKTFSRNEADLQKLLDKGFKGKLLIISEAWCGDASATVPAIAKFFEGYNEVKIFFRDADANLINQFLTDGTQAIPKVLILNEDFEVINTWGPRPQYGTELLKKFKADPENYPREEFYNDLQLYYAKNKGKDAINEILELL